MANKTGTTNLLGRNTHGADDDDDNDDDIAVVVFFIKFVTGRITANFNITYNCKGEN